ncbi:MAG: hypothetical protein H6797_00230 [Candidatus Nomurabacteria bacterium]|nr:MAG: hypothetical protein H6797_00230 [Candidatus Nomurabacteria bacterium]
MRRLILAIVVSLVWVAGSHTGVANALSSGDKLLVSADNTFYVYVKAGEKLSVAFIRSQYYEVNINMLRVDVSITVDGPDVKQQKCIAKRDIAVGKGCVFKPVTAVKTGIWRINFTPAKGARPFEEVSPTVRWGKNLFSWDITVTGNNGEQHGRMWTEGYATRQSDPNQADATNDFTYYYVSEDGYIYKQTENQYNGQVSILSADSIGIRKDGGCISVYQSTEVEDKDYTPALGSCGDKYKLFFEQPAGDLPTNSVRWDGTKDWMLPNVGHPVISELHFIPDGSKDQLSGNITFFLHNFIGQYQVKVDTDGDGSFDGQNDVTLNEQMSGLSNDLLRIPFQGVDKTGGIISPSSKIGIEVVITRVAEIHFVASDVEGRGGIAVTRLNGDNAPTTRLCWNDADLVPIADIRFTTTNVDGRDCPESGGGIHGWAYDNYSWGNGRYIDDWTYATAKLDGKNTVTYPESTTEAIAKKQSNWLPAILAGGAVVLIGSVVVVVVIVRRRKTPPPVAPLAPPGVQSTGSQEPTSEQPSDLDRY